MKPTQWLERKQRMKIMKYTGEIRAGLGRTVIKVGDMCIKDKHQWLRPTPRGFPSIRSPRLTIRAFRFKIFPNTMITRVLPRFFRLLIKDSGRNVFLILDNLRFQHAKLIKEKQLYGTRPVLYPSELPTLKL